VGSALGIVIAHAVVSFAPLVGLPNLVILSMPIDAIGLALLVAVTAAVVAGLVPSRRAAALVRVRGAIRS
jgi:ABC-type antimicrobial peptide transport system permease subunit